MADMNFDSSLNGEEEKRKKWLIYILLAVLFLIIIIFAVHRMGYFRFPWEPAAMITGNVKEGDLAGGSEADLKAALQKHADESQVSFKINGNPVFESGSSEGSLYIANPSQNNYDMQVEIELTDTEEQIYQSEMITPNHYIDYDKLEKSLAKGSYEATAYINFYEDGTALNQVSIALEITVEN